MLVLASLTLTGLIAGALLLSWGYFRRYAVDRPPVGVLSTADVGLMMAGIVAVPYLYLALPTWLLVALLAVGALNALALAWGPVLRRPWAVGLAALLPLALAALLAGSGGALGAIANNIVVIGMAVGLSNLWAQSGLRARDCAVLAAALTLYDLVATSLLPLMGELLARLGGLPLAPLLAWPAGDGRWLGVGLGDLLLAAVFPLVMRRAFGRTAGAVALAIGLAACAALLMLPPLGLLRATFPVMVVLGPLMLAQYALWRRGREERTTRAYLLAEPLR